MDLKKFKLSHDKLRRKADISFLGKVDETLEAIIGQEKAIKALEFGISMDSKGYNVFVSGEHGTGKHSAIEDVVKEYALKQEVPCDQVLVPNFTDEHNPLVLELSAGQGKEFKKEYELLEYRIEKGISLIDLVDDGNLKIEKDKEEKELTRKLNMIIGKYGLIAEHERDKEGNILGVYFKLENSDGLDKEQQIQLLQSRIQEKDVEEASAGFAVGIQNLMLTYAIRKEETRKSSLKEKEKVIESNVKFLREKFKLEYLDSVEKYFKENISEIKDSKKCTANVVVDNSLLKGAPVIYEKEPTLDNLVGNITRNFFEKQNKKKNMKVGSLVKANGGYLILDAMSVLQDARAWNKLIHAVKNKEVVLSDGYGIFGSETKTEPLSANVKVVLVGEKWLRYALQHYVSEFSSLFKVHSEFKSSMKYQSDSIGKYIAFINKISSEEKMNSFSKSGIEALLEESLRRCDSNKKLSCNFGYIADLMREANHFSSKEVTRKDVEKAVYERSQRSNGLEEGIQEYINEDILKINVHGREIGQINGLAVYDLGDYSFGKPSRITAVSSVGSGEVVNIEQEVDMGGEIYNKSMHILAGRLKSKYGQDKTLCLDASLAFEQSYGGVDGDSATLASLCALYSSLSGLGINQGLAITGSADQYGNAQAIGGVNEKIEGWYKTCKEKGFTGEQGVVIPYSNLDDLMLNNEIVESVKKGEFSVYFVRNDEEAAQIMIGCDMKFIDKKINEKLLKYEKVVNE